MERLTFMSDGYYAVDSDNCFDDQNENYCGPTINKLAAYEDTGLTPEEIKGICEFKKYWDNLYGQGLEVTNWHQNGETEPFDNFYEAALEELT